MSTQNQTPIPVFKRVHPDDYNVTTFQVFKEWSIDDASIDDDYIKFYEFIAPPKYLFKTGIVPLSSSKYTPNYTTDNKEKTILWNSINQLFYSSDKDKDYNRYDYINTSNIRNLHQSGSMLVVPQQVFGEGIKSNSVNITDFGLGIDVHVKDDGVGNLYDLVYNTSSFVSDDYLVSYWGFNEKYNYRSTSRKKDKNVKDYSTNEFDGELSGSYTVTEGITTTGLDTVKSGHRLDLHNGYMRVKNQRRLNFRTDEEFAISMWINLPSEQSNTDSTFNHILSKNTLGDDFKLDRQKGLLDYGEVNVDVPHFPYSIKVYNQTDSTNNGKIYVSRYGGKRETWLTSSAHLTGSDHHITFQKSGSSIQLFVDGVLDTSTSDKVNGSTHNKADLFFGSNGNFDNSLSGSLDEIRIYNKGLSTDEITALADNGYESGSAYQTSRMGNVFYKSGFIISSDPRPKYRQMFSSSFSGSFKSTQTIYEYETICKIRESDFNFTTNPTVRKNDDYESSQPKDLVTHSAWTPYITTVGLYNDDAQLLAVGKLSRPIPKYDDVPMNIIVRWDV